LIRGLWRQFAGAAFAFGFIAGSGEKVFRVEFRDSI